jgi:hypothetical protein
MTGRDLLHLLRARARVRALVTLPQPLARLHGGHERSAELFVLLVSMH